MTSRNENPPTRFVFRLGGGVQQVCGRSIQRTLRLVAVLALLLTAFGVSAQTTYQKPPKEVLDVLNAPVTPVGSVNPTRDYMLLATGIRYPSIAELAQPMLRLAGIRINPNYYSQHLSGLAGRSPYYVALTIKKIADGSERKVALPPGAKINFPIRGFGGTWRAWSADGKHFFFMNTAQGGSELWVGDTETGAIRQIKGIRVNAVTGVPVQWMPDNKTLLVELVSGHGAPPVAPTVPTGPNIQESSGKKDTTPTYEDLLKTPYDEDLFDYYATSQLAFVDTATGKATSIGKPAIFDDAIPSPDGNYVLVSMVHRPYSYLHTLNNFPETVVVLDRKKGEAYKIAELPLADQIPPQGVRTGPRAFEWRPTEPATLVWVEALDGGDPRKKVPFRDKIMTAKMPDVANPAELFKTEHRFRGINWGERGLTAFVNDYDRDRRRIRTQLLDLSSLPVKARTLWERNERDAYNDPGAPVTRTLASGETAILQHGDFIYTAGTGSSPEGDRPFLDRWNLKTFKSERLFRSDADAYETFAALLDDDAHRIVTRRERPIEPLNYYIRTLGAGSGTGGHASAALSPLTHFADPTPQLQGIKKQLVRYKRADGVDLSFTLYLPPGYKEGTRLPTVLWAYPLEYNDADTAGQVTGSTQHYTTITGYSHLFFLLEGYAVLDNATMPVVGDPETMNNTYIEQIVASAKAAIDKAVAMGVTDPERVGVGGHSYGAFMTANLLAHSDLFRAGIARSGAYNRTLTPFGFQSERRTFWEAPDLYIKMSPFVYANKINAPLLLIHGEADNNTGTFPIQSERLYAAIRGNGGTVRYVTLPLEAHGYNARESTEHVLYEMINWFDKYVKHAPPRGRGDRAETK
ncbi:MAG TPA: prolyl oligopeptidase family serine peptidase [Pyrinomonadaceae bacterium]|nr:prolyl oligopeptidase family serine peptidase [Pyrinomonadaceae bacterium]